MVGLCKIRFCGCTKVPIHHWNWNCGCEQVLIAALKHWGSLHFWIVYNLLTGAVKNCVIIYFRRIILEIVNQSAIPHITWSWHFNLVGLPFEEHILWWFNSISFKSDIEAFIPHIKRRGPDLISWQKQFSCRISIMLHISHETISLPYLHNIQ